MKLLVAVIACLLSISQIYGSVLETITVDLEAIADPFNGIVLNGCRQYSIGIAVVADITESVLYCQINGTKGVSDWIKLTSSLSATLITRYVVNITDIGDVQGLSFITTLNNDLQLRYIELDNLGCILFSNPLQFICDDTGVYGYLSLVVSIVDDVVDVVCGISSNVSFLNAILNGVLILVDEVLTLVLALLGGILGDLGL